MPKLWLFCTIWYYRVTLWIKIFTKDPSFPPATLGRRKTWLWGSLGGPWGWSNQIPCNLSFPMISNNPNGGWSLKKSASEPGVIVKVVPSRTWEASRKTPLKIDPFNFIVTLHSISTNSSDVDTLRFYLHFRKTFLEENNYVSRYNFVCNITVQIK